MKLTKKQQQFIKDATTHSEVCTEWRDKIKDAFPKLFENVELEVGKWYKKDGELAVWNNGKDTYGFNDSGYWRDEMLFSTKDITPATDKEVEDALKIEAKKRGFKEGVKFLCAIDGSESEFIENYSGSYNEWQYKNNHLSRECMQYLFNDGKWATIIETITKEEAEKQLGKTIKC